MACFWAVWWCGVWTQEVGLAGWDVEPGVIHGFLLSASLVKEQSDEGVHPSPFSSWALVSSPIK